MPDHLTPEQRHLCMSHNRSHDTKPELVARKWLWRHGYRYRLNVKGIPGKPDIVMRRYHTAIFINGCFWHGHKDCKAFRMPSKNREFWENKIRRNQERDIKNRHILEENGWQVIVLWECELTPKNLENTMKKVELQLQQLSLEIFCTKPYNIPKEEDLLTAAEDWSEYEI
ncbi:MAG: very short patch repair endonuclease [Candidatus Limimorpha sp.]